MLRTTNSETKSRRVKSVNHSNNTKQTTKDIGKYSMSSSVTKPVSNSNPYLKLKKKGKKLILETIHPRSIDPIKTRTNTINKVFFLSHLISAHHPLLLPQPST